MKINWKQKLSSRKFWALVAGLITGIVIYATSPEKSPEALGGIILALGALVSYLISEGWADAARAAAQTDSGGHFADAGKMAGEEDAT